jgi:thioredoxin-like negative regulator of GroEL
MSDDVEALAAGRTLAQEQGITQEIGDAIACLAEAELEAGRVDAARAILEGLVVTNHLDPAAWALLSRAHRRLAQPLAARFCAEVRLAPADPHVRLARAESLLAVPGERGAARAELGALAGVDHPEISARARALIGALSE